MIVLTRLLPPLPAFAPAVGTLGAVAVAVAGAVFPEGLVEGVGCVILLPIACLTLTLFTESHWEEEANMCRI